MSAETQSRVERVAWIVGAAGAVLLALAAYRDRATAFSRICTSGGSCWACRWEA